MATNKQCFCCCLYGYSPIRRIVYQNCGDSYDVCENCRSFHGTCPDHPNNKEASPYPYQQLQSGGGVSGSDQSNLCDSCKLVFQDKLCVKLVTYCICGESFNLCLDCLAAQRKCPNHPVTECDAYDSSNDVQLVNLFECDEDHYLCATSRNKDYCPIHPMSPRK